MKDLDIVCVGGGPGGLYSAILLKRALPSARVRVYERHGPDETFGFGVVFSDATLAELRDADAEVNDTINANLSHWDDIHIHHRGETIVSTGHGFCGFGRKKLLSILQGRCLELGVELTFNREVSAFDDFKDADLVIASDGINSSARAAREAHFEPDIDFRPNRFVWLGSTVPLDAFTFFFKANEDGLFRVHAYRYSEEHSTFIIECTEETWRRAGLDRATEDETVAYCGNLFADELDGHRLISNNSVWRAFPTVKAKRWHDGNVVLLGDAVHTAHFSIGSGTKLAMEDAIALRDAVLAHPDDVPAALAEYETGRVPSVESLQRAAQASLSWFEETERYMGMEPLQFAFSLLTRSLRVNHANLAIRDHKLMGEVDAWVAATASLQAGVDVAPDTPPMFTPFKLRDLLLTNRVVVSPMCQYSATEGSIHDWHLVHLGSRAVGGAGLVMTEMTDVSAAARITPGCAGMYEPAHVAAWQRVVRFVHENSQAKIGMQLAHAGRKGSTRLMWEGIDEPLAAGNWPLLAASALPYFSHSQVPKAMDRADMKAVISDFESAARGADAAGFDLLELHLAHGYLLATFVSPLTNRRTDGYGGSVEGRMRFPLEVVDAVRRVWPAHKPMSARISAVDWVRGGQTADDTVELAKMLKAHDCDIIDVSAGQTSPDAKPEYGRLFQTPFSERVRLEANVPTITVGNISSYSDVNSIIAAGRADLCALARAHLFNPYWTRHAAQDQGYHLEWPNQYKSVERYSPRLK